MEVIGKRADNFKPIYLYEENELKQAFKDNLEVQRVVFEYLFGGGSAKLKAQ